MFSGKIIILRIYYDFPKHSLDGIVVRVNNNDALDTMIVDLDWTCWNFLHLKGNVWNKYTIIKITSQAQWINSRTVISWLSLWTFENINKNF